MEDLPKVFIHWKMSSFGDMSKALKSGDVDIIETSDFVSYPEPPARIFQFPKRM